MEELVKYIVKSLVDNEQEVKIESTREGDEIQILVKMVELHKAFGQLLNLYPQKKK